LEKKMKRHPRRGYLHEPETMLRVPGSLGNRGADIKAQLAYDTLLSVARCPLCHLPMILRMGRRGPYYQCHCPPRGHCS
jgi:hypothetical protein